ncbi:Delta(7)-sterol-C5(6)-desaturase [Auxenochlorella protothecoides]|uniref:Delta(7)-sterol-C5(6)-desaturase n=1 Tax=Auxenochlorella protothecoides TaxID=3075 RepID=A0A087SCK1_AUXPR|nr:Delta(7)-sterol-C5(6)-desaturase [Auxenochlorella protothecoides]KFM23455.1 Delta(7)-sterol-C5(6)-desaturase [Auxenochlorella protothecoides]RMZ55926.1 hypothetical protein APUTEX25_004350 [Auxenochlorella protothecoides]|eukprot:RMZ55926.1 hypothetical protein APUTEX25_004350 [Auxenochlorella protothecoides]
MRAGPLVVALLAATAVAIYASPLTDVLVWKLGSRGDGLGRGEGLDLTVSGTGIPGSVEAWGTPAPASLTRRQEQLLEFREENAFKDNLALFWLPNEWRAAMPPYVQSWLRNWIMVAILYYVLGGVWVYYTYYAFGSQLFKPGEIPSLGAQLEQMKVASISMPLYAMLPAFNEFAIEKGWTRTYSRVSDVGLPMYVVYFFTYMLSVEFFVYWAHRLLHEIKPGYKWLHYIHHKYNKEHTLSPFAGLAFHPIDGMLQACPYTFMLWFVPMHLLTHELLLFATGIWTNNIHDNIDGKVPPVMGAYYHTIHHTMYNKNYGHYFTFVDRLFGTLLTPEDYRAMIAERKVAKET